MMTMSSAGVGSVGLTVLPALMEPPFSPVVSSTNRVVMESSGTSVASRSMASVHSPTSAIAVAPHHHPHPFSPCAASGRESAPPPTVFSAHSSVSPHTSPSNSIRVGGGDGGGGGGAGMVPFTPPPPPAGTPGNIGRQKFGGSCCLLPTSGADATSSCPIIKIPGCAATMSAENHSENISDLVASTFRQYAAVQKSHSVDDVMAMEHTVRRKRLPASRRSVANLSASVTDIPRPNVMLHLPGQRCFPSSVSSPELLSSGSSSNKNNINNNHSQHGNTASATLHLEKDDVPHPLPSGCVGSSSAALNAHCNPSIDASMPCCSRYNPSSPHLIARSTPFRRLRFPSFDAVEIIPGLFLSAHHCASDLEALRAYNISLVVNVATECSVKEELQRNQVGVRYIKFFLRDHSDENIAPILAPISKIMHNQLHRRAAYLAAKKAVELVGTPTEQAKRDTETGTDRGFPPKTEGEEGNAAAAAAAALASVDERDAGGVLVHCRMGVSRSATLVLAYLMLFGEHVSGLPFDSDEFKQLWREECFTEEKRVVKLLMGSTYGWRYQTMKPCRDDDVSSDDGTPLASRTSSSIGSSLAAGATPPLAPIPWTNAMPLIDVAVTPPSSSAASSSDATQDSSVSPARTRVRLQRQIVCTVCQNCSKRTPFSSSSSPLLSTAVVLPASASTSASASLCEANGAGVSGSSAATRSAAGHTSHSSECAPSLLVKMPSSSMVLKPRPPEIPSGTTASHAHHNTRAGYGVGPSPPLNLPLHSHASHSTHVPLVTFLPGPALDDDTGVASQSLTPSSSSTSEDGARTGAGEREGSSGEADVPEAEKERERNASYASPPLGSGSGSDGAVRRGVTIPPRIGMSMERALEYVHAHKEDINPNIGFVMALQDLSAQLDDTK